MIYDSDKIFQNKYENSYFKPLTHKYYLRLQKHENHCVIKNRAKLALVIPYDTLCLALVITGHIGCAVGSVLQLLVK